LCGMLCKNWSIVGSIVLLLKEMVLVMFNNFFLYLFCFV
jgi:hypothetical protein